MSKEEKRSASKKRKLPTTNTVDREYDVVEYFQEYKQANFLWIANRPIGKTGFYKKEKMGIEALQSNSSPSFNFRYSESIFIPPELDNKFDHLPDDELWKKIEARLSNPLNNYLHVCYIDDEVGYGVFTSVPIKAGTIIGIYAGIVEKRGYKDDYGINIEYEDSDESGYIISAYTAGGITRFIQHMPNEQEDKISPQLKSICATANLRSYQLMYSGVPIIYFVACRNIEKNEQLGISYGNKYWSDRNKTPKYFYKNGKVIPTSVMTISSSSSLSSPTISPSLSTSSHTLIGQPRKNDKKQLQNPIDDAKNEDILQGNLSNLDNIGISDTTESSLVSITPHSSSSSSNSNSTSSYSNLSSSSDFSSSTSSSSSSSASLFSNSRVNPLTDLFNPPNTKKRKELRDTSGNKSPKIGRLD